MNDNHHFLPVFYLNGFRGINKKLIYFRKEYGSFRESSPAGIFYKPGLNDVDLGEHGYIDLENEFFRVTNFAGPKMKSRITNSPRQAEGLGN